MQVFKGICLSLGFLAFGAIANADTITIQLGSGVLNFSGGVPDQVVESGAIINPALTLNVPSNLNFYTPTYNALCTTCTGTLSGNLTANLIVTDMTTSGSGSGSFSQSYMDVISGGTHTFTPEASSTIDIALSNGDTLMITPLSGNSISVSTSGSNSSSTVAATFLLTKTVPSVPEPSSSLLLLTGLGVATLCILRKRRVEA